MDNHLLFSSHNSGECDVLLKHN